MDASYIIYTGLATTYVPITPGQDLQTILQNIDAAINSSSSAPDYSGYNLYCVKQTDGTTHPTNTRNFAEGISKNLCDFHTDYDTFTGTTYVSDQLVLVTAINGLQSPALTYVPFSITSADGIATVWSKVFTGLTAMTTSIDPYTANWGTLSITPSHSVVTTWNNVITYLNALSSTVSGKQASLGTFDNSGNCLSGGATDSALTTINLLRTYICSLPTFSTSGYTWGCISLQTTLSDTIGAILTGLNTVNAGYVSNVGTGLTISSGTCGGTTVDLDTTYTGLYKVMLSTGDTTADADYLDSKVSSNGGSIDITIVSNKLNLEVAEAVNNKVKVNSSDSTAGYLEDKIQSSAGMWGLANVTSTFEDTTVLVTPTITDTTLFASSLMSIISANPELLVQFKALIDQASITCSASSNLVVTFTITPNVFTLTWTPGSSIVSQTVKYRQRGDSNWITSVNIDPPNPETDIAVTADVNNLLSNTVYQFAVDSTCALGTQTGSAYEQIIYECPTMSTNVVAGAISASVPLMSTVGVLVYTLYDPFGVPTQVISTPATSPNVTFSVVSAGTWHVHLEMRTLVNGVLLLSSDPSQLGAACISSGIVVP